MKEGSGQFLDIGVGGGGCNLIGVLGGEGVVEVVLEVGAAGLAVVAGGGEFVVVLRVV